MYRETIVALLVISGLHLALFSAKAEPLEAIWTEQRRASIATGEAEWLDVDRDFAPDRDGVVYFNRGSLHHARIGATIDADLSQTPWLQIIAHSSSAQWRLTSRLNDGPELLVADQQLAGICRRNLAELLGTTDSGELHLYLHIWGWGSGAEHYVRFTPSLLAEGEKSDAREMLGEMAVLHARNERSAQDISLRVESHPRLRFNEDNRDHWRDFAAEHPRYARPFVDILAELDERKAEAPYVLSAETYRERRPAWGANLLAIRPPQPPERMPGEGGYPFPGMNLQTIWRQLYWHNFSHWLVGDALSDDPVFREQAHRWAVTLSEWYFWRHPDYVYFDFSTSYPLQCLASAYDIARTEMSQDERALVREAIGALAHGLYLNALSGHGSIYNDLRGNHTAVTFCGLGMAGAVLLGEDERAPLWIALAERFMLDAFEENQSGGWLESPSYGSYGVNEWFRLAEVLNNVTGRNHLEHPFLHRFAEYQLHVADWEGRDLGYNHGGARSYWNQWVYFGIAREFQDPRFQWLANPTEDVSLNGGYGDQIWWVDPDLAAERPTETNTGRHFADIGLSVWRSGWSDDATILLHQCGMKGQHKQENMNHVTLYALGERILPDGLGGSTEDHNVPMIDDRIQNKWMPGATLAYHSDRRSGYSLGDTQAAYSGSRRHVLFLRPDVVVLIDELNLGDREDRNVRFLLHPAGETTAEGSLLSVVSEEVNLQATTVLPDGTELTMTAEEREDEGPATHDAWASFTGSGDLRAITFLLISPTADVPAPQIEAADGRLTVRHRGREIVLGLSDGEIAPGFSTDADLWLARIEDGEPQSILVPGVEQMGDVRSELTTPAGVISGNPSLSWGR